MHPAVKKSWEIGQELKMNVSELSKHVGLSSSTYHYWLKGEKEPRKKSIEKMQRFIERYEAGETFKPKPKAKIKNIPIENIENEEKRPMYYYLYQLEDKYGATENWDKSDPLYKKLREEAGA